MKLTKLFHKALFFSLIVVIGFGCARSHNPLSLFEVEPYARPFTSQLEYGGKISVVLDPMIQQLQLTNKEDGGFSMQCSYNDYRKSIEKSISNMLEGSFNEISFLKAAPQEGLVLHVHRIKPKMRQGELISEYVFTNEFLFDYDMSLSLDSKVLHNAVGLNAHPTTSIDIRRVNWTAAAQISLKLVLEDCYNELFVKGLAEG